LVAAEAALLVLASRACAEAGFPVSVARPLALACLASLPMAAAVAAVASGPLAAVAVGVTVYAATLALARRLALHVRYS
jgi:hypothetical protein